MRCYVHSYIVDFTLENKCHHISTLEHIVTHKCICIIFVSDLIGSKYFSGKQCSPIYHFHSITARRICCVCQTKSAVLWFECSAQDSELWMVSSPRKVLHVKVQGGVCVLFKFCSSCPPLYPSLSPPSSLFISWVPGLVVTLPSLRDY